MRRLAIIVASALLTGCAFFSPHPALLRPAKLAGAPAPETMVIQSREVTVDVARLSNREVDHFTLPTFGRERLTLVRDRTEEIGSDGLAWHGHVEGEPGSAVTIVLRGGVVVGNIATQRGRHYQIRHLGRDVHRFQEVDLSKLPPEGKPLDPPRSPTGRPGRPETSRDTCETDPGSDIDVLVLYTDDARVGAGSAAAMEALVYLAVEETNQSYVNSNVNHRLRLAHVEEVSYAETGNDGTDLTRLQNGTDGFLDGAPTLRNTFAADVVLLITESAVNCGRGYQMATVSNAFESFAYAVVLRSCATGNYSFGHEVGHIMGARHDWGNDGASNSPHAYNHGHLVTAPASTTVSPWRTIMAVNSSCQSTATVNCTRVQYWSNPNVSYPPGGAMTNPMGVATGMNQTDNHRTLNDTALTVANFRCSSPGASNVWMKDTWNDTGKEPDPATAVEDMWRSPYIWVRATQDTGRTHQHQHENPQQGSSPWVYAKLHNGATTATSGALELYYADASVSLTWPTSWTLLGSVPVNGFVAGSTTIVEKQWPIVPSAGHYCLLARWVSAADPMAAPEGSDINGNVRANNNLVWRNLDIIPLTGGDEPADASFDMRNTTRERMMASLVVRGPRGERQPSFLTHGEVALRLDQALWNAWNQGGRQGNGFKIDGDRLLITSGGARLDGLLLPPRFAGKATLTMGRLPSTPRRDFRLDVVHMVGDRTIGGVSYEIRTDQ